MTSCKPELSNALPFAKGDVFSRELRFDADAIRAFAVMVGDESPLHHDEMAAKASQFGTLIASGTQTVSLMMATVASFFTAKGPALGLGFAVTLRRAVKAGTVWRAVWTIEDICWKESLHGHVVGLSGVLTNDQSEIAIEATARSLFLMRA